MPDRMPVREVAVSWQGDGTFGGLDNNLTDRTISNTIAVQYGRDAARPLGEPMLSTATWDALNDDRLLSPEYGGSAIYGLIVPGKPTRIQFSAGDAVDYDAADIAYDAPLVFYDGFEALPVHAGLLEVPQYHPALNAQSVTFSALGRLSSLQGFRLTTELHQAIRVDQAITLILDLAGWPGALRDLAVADSTLEWFWMDNEDAFDKLVQLQHTEGVPSLIWEGPDGVIHFENRNYRNAAARSLVSQAQFYDYLATNLTYDDPIDYDAAVLYDGGAQLSHSGLEYAQPYQDIHNQITQRIATRITQPDQQIWEYGQALILGPSESKTVVVLLDDPCPSYVPPAIVSNDYVVSSGALASVPAITEPKAQRFKITFTATGAGATVNGVVSDGPRVRGTPAKVMFETEVTNSVDTSASITKYGGPTGIPRSLALQAIPEINPATAITLCDAAATYYQEQRPVVTVRLLNIDYFHLMQQMLRRPSDRISPVSTPLGFTGDVWIEQIDLRVVPEGVETVFTCERATSEPGAGLWDTALWDSGIWGR